MSYQVKASLLLASNVSQQKNSFIRLTCQQYRYQSTDKKAPKEVPKGIPYNKLTIGVPKEVFANEKRVSITPAVVKNLTKKGFNLTVEENAGLLAKFSNKEYEEAGAKITNVQGVYSAADIILKVRAPEIQVDKLSFDFS